MHLGRPRLLLGSLIEISNKSKLFLLLGGRELLSLQGIYYTEETLQPFSEKQLTDLAGNSFTTTVAMAVTLAALLETSFTTESESEEECQLQSFVSASPGNRFRLLITTF